MTSPPLNYNDIITDEIDKNTFMSLNIQKAKSEIGKKQSIKLGISSITILAAPLITDEIDKTHCQ